MGLRQVASREDKYAECDLQGPLLLICVILFVWISSYRCYCKNITIREEQAMWNVGRSGRDVATYGPCFVTMDKLLLLPQSSRNTSRPQLASSKGIFRSESESANFHCEEICRVRTEGEFAFKNLFPNEINCLTQRTLAYVGTVPHITFLREHHV